MLHCDTFNDVLVVVINGEIIQEQQLFKDRIICHGLESVAGHLLMAESSLSLYLLI